MVQLNKIIYENLFNKAIAKEGGNAVEGVDRIEKENIEPTFKQIKKQIIYPLYRKRS